VLRQKNPAPAANLNAYPSKRRNAFMCALSKGTIFD